jgi:hypothetical protein
MDYKIFRIIKKEYFFLDTIRYKDFAVFTLLYYLKHLCYVSENKN